MTISRSGRYAAELIPPTVVTILVLIDVVSKVNDIVDGVFVHDIAICIEESERIVGTRKYCKLDIGDVFASFCRDGFGSAYHRLDIRVTDIELVPF